jgi:hypothetical protein
MDSNGDGRVRAHFLDGSWMSVALSTVQSIADNYLHPLTTWGIRHLVIVLGIRFVRGDHLHFHNSIHRFQLLLLEE